MTLLMPGNGVDTTVESILSKMNSAESGYIHFGKLRVFSMTGCMATTYILAEFLIFTVRRWNNIYITLFLYMPVSIVFSVINVAPITMAIDEIYPAPLAFGLLIPAVCIGIFANKYVIKKLTNCRSDLK